MFLMLAAVLMATGCDDGFADEPIGEVKNALTVEEAEAYFEQAMAQEPVTRSAGSKALIPDDFTPEWSKSVSTSYGNVSCLNVPVSSFTGYKARYMQGKERIVNIAQKLVVFKNTDTGEKAQFLLTLLPCYGYVNAHKGEDIAGLFVQGGTKSGFSGLALYISPESGIVYGVSSFVNGHRTGTATCSSDKATKQQLTALVRRASFCQFFATRAGMEDFGWDYNMGVEVEDGNMLPEVIVTPPGGMPYVENDPFNQWLFDNFNDPEDPPGVDRNENDNNCGYCPGDGYGHCIGGGGTTTSGGDNQQGGKYKPIKLKYDVSLYPGYTDGQCGKIAYKITRQILGVSDGYYIGDYNHRIELCQEDDKHTTLNVTGDTQEIIAIIAKHLAAGCPIVAGVNHTLNYGINNGTTDHFIVINGINYDEEGRLYFNYIETGRKKENAASACDDSWRLYYYSDTTTYTGKDGKKHTILPGMIFGDCYNKERYYTISEIRPYLK